MNAVYWEMVIARRVQIADSKVGSNVITMQRVDKGTIQLIHHPYFPKASVLKLIFRG